MRISLALWGGIFALLNGVHAAERVTLATQIWTPYQTVDGDGVIGGVAVNRVKCALQGMSQPYEIHVMRWDKAQLLVETGEMDGFFAGSANQRRKQYATASMPIVSDNLAWFVAPNLYTDVQNESAKYSLRYGAKFNTNKWLYLKREGYNVIRKPRDANSLLQMLWQGDLDVAYEYELVFEEAMKNAAIPLAYFQRIRVKPQNLMVHFSHHFLRQHPGFLDRFNDALSYCMK
ncbi:transporter substrate-binding domain-containing protein [Vibrio sp. SM6]|uniref:Transporter substrate-binding domain-containing protein n=2 Tax=Vibrio agarilyticus TaxID=2726741 RepID=A0A7X8TNE8_9VIBR|nr:transporter substrate-binding domain-containing protein [Vibrio agarilyticus]NLS11775.1 transporter substrate-binding domain-containing protein [Vibrio agarilyticus]